MRYEDKNGNQLVTGDYICIDQYPYKIENFPFVGIGISTVNNKNLPLIYLKDRHKNQGNTQGLIPLSFIDLEKIIKCDKEAYPECFI